MLQPSPGMEPTWGQSEEMQERPQWHERTGTIDGSQEPNFGGAVGQARLRQREFRDSKQNEGEPKKCCELLHASSERQNFLLDRKSVV